MSGLLNTRRAGRVMSQLKVCEYCKEQATVYAMGANAGDWGGYYCDNHFPTGFQITDRLTKEANE